MKRGIVGAGLLMAGLGLAAYTYWFSSGRAERELVFSANSMLANTWSQYKKRHLEPSSGRMVDPAQQNVTTSEAQSYCLLRAVWQDDKPTFDRCWKFTRDNLKRRNDWLFAWRYGQLPDGSYGVLTEQGGNNSASDADTDIALALVMAYGRWQQSAYLEQAKPIIEDIWRYEVVAVSGRPVVVANNLERSKQHMIINPSYWAPYAYRTFAVVDRQHDWRGLVDNTYHLLDRTMTEPLDQPRSAGLPPNWLVIDRQTGALTPAERPELTTDYGYDALRVPWRLALDVQWHQEERARQLLERMSFLSDQWQQQQKLAAGYRHDGTVAADYESPAMYGGSLGHFMVKPAEARAVYETKIKALYNEDTKAWSQQQGYYEDNWAWFGGALYLQALPDLTKEIRP